MARPRSTKKDKAAAVEIENLGPVAILAALKFLEPAASQDGPANQTHCMLRNGTAVIFNGLIAMGTMVDIKANCNPHLLMLISALSKCKGETKIEHNPANNTLLVASGRFRANIPCLGDDLFGEVIPANPIAPLDDRVKTSLEIVGRVAVENSPRLMCATVYIREGSAVATDGVIMFEHWHGNSLPPMAIPKVSVGKLCKIAKKFVSFGITYDTSQIVNSITFWFEDNTWFRTQLYVEPWPSIDRVLESPANPWPVPAGLWEGLKMIEDFTNDMAKVILSLKTVSTHGMNDMGASFDIEGALPERLVLNHDKLTMFSGLATQVDWACTPDLVMFRGDNFRGCLAKVKETIET